MCVKCDFAGSVFSIKTFLDLTCLMFVFSRLTTKSLMHSLFARGGVGVSLLPRPKMGVAKAKQSAGQKALDLTKQANRMKDMDLKALLHTDGKKLKELGLPVQERKRLLNFIDKYLRGYKHDGRPGQHAWKGWRAPSFDGSQ